MLRVCVQAVVTDAERHIGADYERRMSRFATKTTAATTSPTGPSSMAASPIHDEPLRAVGASESPGDAGDPPRIRRPALCRTVGTHFGFCG
jgi:hypothetical protein